MTPTHFAAKVDTIYNQVISGLNLYNKDTVLRVGFSPNFSPYLIITFRYDIPKF